MKVRTAEVDVVEDEKMKKEKVEVGWIRCLWIRWRRIWRGGEHGWGGSMKLLEMKVEAGWVGGEVGLWENLLIFSLEFSDIPAEFLVCRIRMFVVE